MLLPPIRHTRDETASIPDACLPVVHACSGMSQQLFPQHVVHFNCALGGHSLPSNLSCPRLNTMGMRGSWRMWWTPPRSSQSWPQPQAKRPGNSKASWSAVGGVSFCAQGSDRGMLRFLDAIPESLPGNPVGSSVLKSCCGFFFCILTRRSVMPDADSSRMVPGSPWPFSQVRAMVLAAVCVMWECLSQNSPPDSWKMLSTIGARCVVPERTWEQTNGTQKKTTPGRKWYSGQKNSTGDKTNNNSIWFSVLLFFFSMFFCLFGYYFPSASFFCVSCFTVAGIS